MQGDVCLDTHSRGLGTEFGPWCFVTRIFLEIESSLMCAPSPGQDDSSSGQRDWSIGLGDYSLGHCDLSRSRAM